MPIAKSETPGREVLTLYDEPDHPEKIRLVRFTPGTRAPEHDHPGGEEIFVLDGTIADGDGTYPQGTWVRFPDGSRHQPWSEEGCTLYVKVGHLRGL